MTKIHRRVRPVKFVKTAHDSESDVVKRPVMLKNGAIKSPQQSVQTETYRGPIRKHNERAMKIVNHFAKTAAADIKQGTPLFYHPDFEPSSLILPKDRIEINSWCNYFYKYDALVSTAIDMHAELPLSKIRLDLPKTQDKKLANRILEHYVDMIGNTGIDLFNKLLMFGVEYNKLGNVFPWAQMNASGTKWEKLTCLNPDYVHLEKLGLTNALSINLVPDDKLRRIVHAGPYDEKTGLLYQTLSDEVIERVRSGKEITLPTDPNEGSHATHIARKLADYIDWGTSLIERNFKTLVYKDRLRQSQDAIAARHLTPKHLIWSELSSKADVNEIREQVEDAMMNPDSAIITNYELHWELIGTSSGLMQLGTEHQWISDDLMIGLMINKNILLGEGRFAGGQTVLEVLNQRYSIFREVLEAYIERNLFTPIARNNEFLEYQPSIVDKGKKLVYLYPQVRWNRLNLTDETQHKQMMTQAVTEGKIDVSTWLEHFGLNADTVAQRLKANEDTVLDPTYNELRRSIMMEVGRSLGPAVAKVYADAYGLELPDQGGMGGMGMFGSSKVPITKFAKDFDIDYNKDGGITIKPKMITEEFDVSNATKASKNKVGVNTNLTKTAETREQREHERAVNQSTHRIESIKSSLEVKDNKILPPRKDLEKVPQMFGMKNIGQQFDKSNIKVSADESSEEQSNKTIEIDVKPLDGLSSGYDTMTVYQSHDKVADVVDRLNKTNIDLTDFSQMLKKEGVDQNTRQLLKIAENELSTLYYQLTNNVNNASLKTAINKRMQQIYTGVYHSIVAPRETMFKSSQTVKEIFDEDIRKRSSKLLQKIELISTANRKVAQKAKPDEVASKTNEVFKVSETDIRKAFKSIIDDVIVDVKGLLS